MNKQTQEALKMAIENFGSVLNFIPKEYHYIMEYTINACKEALEQPAQTYIVNNTAGTKFQLYEQPAQEPVAEHKLSDGTVIELTYTEELAYQAGFEAGRKFEKSCDDE